MRALKFLITAIGMAGAVLVLRANAESLPANTGSGPFGDDARLHGTWSQNREMTVSNAFQSNPGLTNASPEQIQRFKDVFGHSILIISNGLMTVRAGMGDQTFHYQVLERGTNYVIIHNDDPLQKGRAIRIHFANAGQGFGIVTSSGYEVRFDRISAAGTPSPYRPPAYDESADGLQQISDALVVGKKEGKRVLLQFGANWCGWCLMLHQLFETDKDIAAELRKNYVVVMIDVNQSHNKQVDAKYGNPTRFGLPVIVILDATGKQLTTKNTSEMEEGNHHNPEKVLGFLKEWSVK
jgi:thiol-disulfide isomerase/thioredoxin